MNKRGKAFPAAPRTGHDLSPPKDHDHVTKFHPTGVLLAVLLFLSSCAPATVSAPSDDSVERYAAIIGAYSQQDDALRIVRLDSDNARSVLASAATRDVYIVVHPGYSLFFSGADDQKGMRYGGAKYGMLEAQFLAEARFLGDLVRAGSLVILIVPGSYQTDSIAPLAYAGYLNAVAYGPTVLYLPSTGSSVGTVSSEDMVNLFHFLEAVKPVRVLVGGGYIGRCEREFYNQLTAYYDRNKTFILQEASAVSPDDVTSTEAAAISDGIRRGDYHPVESFLARKLDRDVNTLSIPLSPDR